MTSGLVKLLDVHEIRDNILYRLERPKELCRFDDSRYIQSGHLDSRILRLLTISRDMKTAVESAMTDMFNCRRFATFFGIDAGGLTEFLATSNSIVAGLSVVQYIRSFEIYPKVMTIIVPAMHWDVALAYVQQCGFDAVGNHSRAHELATRHTITTLPNYIRRSESFAFSCGERFIVLVLAVCGPIRTFLGGPSGEWHFILPELRHY